LRIPVCFLIPHPNKANIFAASSFSKVVIPPGFRPTRITIKADCLIRRQRRQKILRAQQAGASAVVVVDSAASFYEYTDAGEPRLKVSEGFQRQPGRWRWLRFSAIWKPGTKLIDQLVIQ